MVASIVAYSRKAIGWKLAFLGIELWLPLVLVALWWVLSDRYESLYMPALSKIVPLFVDLWIFDHTLADLLPSLFNLACGYAAALAAGIVLGTLLGLMPRFSYAIWPTLEFVRAIPGVALLPIFILFLGVGQEMKIALIVSGAIWPILLNTVDGIRGVEPLLLDVSRSFRFSLWTHLRYVILPAASPQIFAGARIALSIAVILVVVSEMVGSNGGIGYFVRTAERTFSIPEMWTGIIMLGLLGYALNTLFRIVERRVLAWQHGQNRTNAK